MIHVLLMSSLAVEYGLVFALVANAHDISDAPSETTEGKSSWR